MQFFATLAALTFAAIGSVAALPSYGAGECSTASIRCCESVEHTDSPNSQMLFSLLALPVPLSGQVGMKCSPVNPTTVGGNPSCSANPVCCNGDHYAGISTGCTPINVAL